jgi:hypothetical protein
VGGGDDASTARRAAEAFHPPRQPVIVSRRAVARGSVCHFVPIFAERAKHIRSHG